ncbi:MAG: hypothetical protein ACLRVN_01235 [Butyricicoccus sp.]
MTAMEARLLSDSFEKAELFDAAAKQVAQGCRKLILSDISKYLNDKGVSLSRDQDDRRQAGCSGQADRGGHHLR